MIRGFEDILNKLNENDKKLAYLLMISFEKYPHGKAHKLTAGNIIAKFEAHGYKINDIKIRQLTHYLRVNDLLIGLCSDSKGYWMSGSEEELKNTYLSLCDRLREQLTTAHALARHYKLLYNKDIKETQQNKGKSLI